MSLQNMRMQRGMTQQELAEKSGVVVGVIRHYEIGYRDIDGAKIKSLAKLAMVLGCHISDLVNDDETKRDLIKMGM